MKKIIFLIFILFFLVLFQTSFLNFLKVVPNFILLTILISTIFIRKIDNLGLATAFLGGLLLDIYSSLPFGIVIISTILVYLISTVFIKLFLRIDFLEVFLIIILGVVAYNILIFFFSYIYGLIFHFPHLLSFNFNYLIFIEIFANLILGVITFYLISWSKKLEKVISH